MRSIGVVFGLFTVLLAPAAAQEIPARLKQVEALVQQNKLTEAMAAIEDASAMIWDHAPLSFRRFHWVEGKPRGFGSFTLRENAVFESGAAMLAYAEPVGFHWRREGDLWRTDMAVAIVVKDAAGKELGRQDNFGKLEIRSRVKNREFMTDFTYTLRGLPAGNYQIETRIRDEVSGKTGSFSLPFTVR